MSSTSSSHKILTRVLAGQQSSTKSLTATTSISLALHTQCRRQISLSSSLAASKYSCNHHDGGRFRSRSQPPSRRHYSSDSSFNSTNQFFRSRDRFHSHTGRRLFSSGGKEDFYKTLGIAKGTDKAGVKKAYFKLAKKYHPDTNKGDDTAAEQFKKVTEAYEVLSDDKQRELYDTYGHAGVDPNSGMGGGDPFGGGNPFGGGGGFNFNDGSFHFSSSGGGQEIDPEELFDAFFGGGRRARGPRRGADLQMSVGLKFREAAFGATKDLNLRYQVQDRQTGRVEMKSRQVEVKVPPGVNDGVNLRLAGQGAEGDEGAPKGDLIVTCVVDEDDYFHRDGADVHVEIPISVTQAILGGTVDVKTLTGEVEMKIPKGCQPDSKMMMRGKGIPYLNRPQQKGNQIVHLKIQIPKKITERQETLLREFDQEALVSGQKFSGRLAEAAGSAFQSWFGKSSKKDSAEKNTENSTDSVENEEEEEKNKKQKAQ